MADMWMKRGDRLPSVTATLTDSQGNPVDLTDAVEVRFYMRTLRPPYDLVVSGVAQVVGDDPADGEVRYDWGVGETDEAGGFYAEWEVEFPDGLATWPNDGYNTVAIVEDLDQGGS